MHTYKTLIGLELLVIFKQDLLITIKELPFQRRVSAFNHILGKINQIIQTKELIQGRKKGGQDILIQEPQIQGIFVHMWILMPRSMVKQN
jgi:hypothetical protein